jgi:hypothetical protein
VHVQVLRATFIVQCYTAPQSGVGNEEPNVALAPRAVALLPRTITSQLLPVDKPYFRLFCNVTLHNRAVSVTQRRTRRRRRRRRRPWLRW